MCDVGGDAPGLVAGETRKAMKKSGLREAVDAPVRPQVRPAHVGNRDPDDGIRRLHDRWRGALFEADVARTVPCPAR